MRYRCLSESALYVNLRNGDQVTLYEFEIKRMLDDEYFEDFPKDDLRSLGLAVARVGTPLGPNFKLKERYDFAMRWWIDIVGNRMINLVKAKRVLGDRLIPTHRDDVLLLMSGPVTDFVDRKYYVQTTLQRILDFGMHLFRASTIDDLQKTIDEIKHNGDYTKTDLLRDLEDISRIVSGK